MKASMFRVFAFVFLVTTKFLCIAETLHYPFVPEPNRETKVTEDYPSDTHVGAVKLFSQLVSDDSGSSRANRDGLAASEEALHDVDKDNDSSGNVGENTDLKSEDFNDSDDSETQYLIEEFYGYTYDEASNTDFDDDNDSMSEISNSDVTSDAELSKA